jgi:mRNA interferase MazF
MASLFPKRGELWLVALDPTVGSEIGKTRPAVVISNDRNNEYAETVTVLPMTSKTEKIYPFEVAIPAGQRGLKVDSKVKASQIRTIAKARLIKRLGTLAEKSIALIEGAVLIHLGMKI